MSRVLRTPRRSKKLVRSLHIEHNAPIRGPARRAIVGNALALTGMVDDKEITLERALDLARKVLRGNAIKLYGLKD